MKVLVAGDKLSRLFQLFLVVLFLQFIYIIAEFALSRQLRGADLVGLVFSTSFIVLLVASVPWIKRRMLWRVRNRILVTYFLVGIVPIMLILTMLLIVAYMLLGQTTSYIVTANLKRSHEVFQNAAYDIAFNTSSGMRRSTPKAAVMQSVDGVRTRLPRLEAIVRVDGETFSVPDDAFLKDFASWIKPGFSGLVSVPGGALVAADSQAAGAEVFAYERLGPEALADLTKGLGNVRIVYVGSGQQHSLDLDRKSIDGTIPVTPGRGFWDIPIRWFLTLPATKLTDGSSEVVVALTGPRPSLILGELFGANLGQRQGTVGSLAMVLLFVAGVVFLTVEAGALTLTAGLTRSITRSVHDLYQGTQQVEAGNFSHRVPVRKRDQLSGLAGSFNEMTERVQKLIAEVAEKKKLELEIQIARDVQERLFPKQVPQLKHLELFGLCKPAQVVSGDYYDIVPVDGKRTALVIADISGKGISAALLMASLQSSLHAHLMVGKDQSPAAIVQNVNRQIYANSPPEKFATFYCSIYDDETGKITYTNAGHLPPILVRGGIATRLEATGTLVGIFPEVEYGESCIELQAGDLLVAFTDGITECENTAGEQFGEERLKKLLVENATNPLDELVKTVLQNLEDWAHDLHNQDDSTILAARRL